jgi:hypothetical protein
VLSITGRVGYRLLLVLVGGSLIAATPDNAIVSHIPRMRVESSAIAAIGYSKRLHALEIEFRSGRIYRYLDVPIET